MPKHPEALALIMQNLVNDESLDHLSVKDLRNILLNIQPVVNQEEEDEDDEIDENELKRYIL
jgi:hypothetical protein